MSNTGNEHFTPPSLSDDEEDVGFNDIDGDADNMELRSIKRPRASKLNITEDWLDWSLGEAFREAYQNWHVHAAMPLGTCN